MPPRCPGCGRFLSSALVEGLVEEPTECPSCGRRLTVTDFTTAPDAVAATTGSREEATGVADPLEGWDEQTDAGDLPAERAGRRLMPEGTVLALVGLLGAVLGAVVTKRRVGAFLGGFAGFLLGVVERRLWEGH